MRLLTSARGNNVCGLKFRPIEMSTQLIGVLLLGGQFIRQSFVELIDIRRRPVCQPPPFRGRPDMFNRIELGAV